MPFGLLYARQKWPATPYGTCRICGAKGKHGAARVCYDCWQTWAAWPKSNADIIPMLQVRQGMIDGRFGSAWKCPRCPAYKTGYGDVALKAGLVAPVASLDDLELICEGCAQAETKARMRKQIESTRAAKAVAIGAEWDAYIENHNRQVRSRTRTEEPKK